MDLYIELAERWPAAFYLVILLLGLCVGSFLNVVIYRLPVMMERGWRHECECLLDPETERSEPETFNLAVPASRCPGCNQAIRAWQNIPVLSYLLLGGKCGNCKTSISLRYPSVEALTGLLSVLVAWRFGFSAELLPYLFLLWCLIALTLIDADTQLLPDSITLPLLWAGLLFNLTIGPVAIEQALIGAMLGYLSLWSVYWLFKLLTGKEGMGYGDFKLLAALGAWLGWQALPLIIILSSLVGAVLGSVMLMRSKQSQSTPIPFGPYLAIAGFVALLWGEQLVQAYLQFAGMAQ